MLTISEQIKKLRDLAELCASTSDHMMAKYLNDAADTIEKLLKSYMDIKAEIENNSFTNQDGTEVVDCLVVYMTINKYLDKIMNEYTKVRKFPKDCPKECKYLRSWDLSIDDWTNVCTKLQKQVDDCDWDSPFCPFCPLTIEELKEACEERKKEIGKEDTYGD